MLILVVIRSRYLTPTSSVNSVRSAHSLRPTEGEQYWAFCPFITRPLSTTLTNEISHRSGPSTSSAHRSQPANGYNGQVRYEADDGDHPLLIRLLNDKSAQGYDLSFVKQFNTGAAPLADQVIAQLARKFPTISVRQAWGMTETTSCLTVTPPDLSTWSNASKVGKLVPGTQIRVVDPDTGEDVPAGGVGEIWAKGPQVTMGYLDRPEETAKSYLEDGFFKTGDLGSIDNQGFIKIHDRIKEMIKVRGHAVAPAELEDLLHGHPKVKDAATIGIPDDYSGETPRAFVVLVSGVQGVPEIVREIQDFVASRKAKHKRLSGGVEFVDQIPKSPSGKILRRVLKASWKEKTEPQRAKLRFLANIVYRMYLTSTTVSMLAEHWALPGPRSAESSVAKSQS
ncbi:hypothetical protein Lal_00008600 [Lupinus albus]|nr:hypothetical protein Lal_00008600 [Lupinus albus]